jgi:4-amino-4-deoxy-L-arabinose transferase-like glycosyltransferase
MKNKLYLIINIFTVLIFVYLFINLFIFDVSVFYKVNNLISLIASFITIILWIVLYHFIHKKYSNVSIKTEIIIVTFIMLIVLLLQYLIIKELAVNPSWDFAVVFKNAENFVSYGNRLDENIYFGYFELFPNNIMLFVMLTIFIKVGIIFGISTFHSALIMNIFFIDLAILLLYICVRKWFGKDKGLFALILCFFFSPLFLYVPIFYTDTISLPFGIILILLYGYIKDSNKLSIKNIVLYLLFGICFFIALTIKMTLVFIIIAILFDIFIRKRILLTISFLMLTLIAYIGCSTLYNSLVINNNDYNFNNAHCGKIPYTHWIMMGIEDPKADNSTRNSYGGFNENDYNLTKSLNTEKERINFNINEIERRIRSYGAPGYMVYLTKKAVNAWGDGTYFAPIKLSLNPMDNRNTTAHQIFLSGGKYYKFYLYFAQGVQFSFLIILILSATYNIKKKDEVNSINFIHLSIIMLLAFLLMWENRSRYLVTYIPIFIFLISFYIKKIYAFTRKIFFK